MTALAIAIVCVEGEIHALMRDGADESSPAVMARQIPGPGTHPADWLPDYQRAHPCRTYLPQRPVPGRRYKSTGRKPGRPRRTC